MSRFAKAVAGGLWLRSAGMGLAAVSGILLARGMGLEGYGVYGVAMAVLSLLSVPAEFGVPQLVTREIAIAHAKDDWARLREVLRWAHRAVLTNSVAVAVIVGAWLAVSAGGSRGALESSLLVGLAIVPLTAIGNIQSNALRGTQRLIQGQLAGTVIRPGLVCCAVALALVGWGAPLSPAVAIGLGVVASALTCVVTFVLLRRALPRRSSAPARSQGYWRSAFPMGLMEGMRVLQHHLVTLIIGVVGTAKIAGLYRVALAVAPLVLLVDALMSSVGSPVVARLNALGDREALRNTLRNIAWAMTAGSAAILLPMLIAGEWLMALMFGEEFSRAASAVCVMASGVSVGGMFGNPAMMLSMVGLEKRVARASVLSVCCLLVVAPPAIWAWGADGAAASSATAVLLWRVWLWRDCMMKLQLNTSIFPWRPSRDEFESDPIAIGENRG